MLRLPQSLLYCRPALVGGGGRGRLALPALPKCRLLALPAPTWPSSRILVWPEPPWPVPPAPTWSPAGPPELPKPPWFNPPAPPWPPAGTSGQPEPPWLNSPATPWTLVTFLAVLLALAWLPSLPSLSLCLDFSYLVYYCVSVLCSHVCHVLLLSFSCLVLGVPR